MARAGKDAATIAREFRAEGRTTAKGNPMTREAVYVKLGHVGLGRAQRRREMLLVLRQMLIDGARPDEILARLAKEFPGLCQWTRKQLNQLTMALRRGVSDVPALPALLPRDHEKQAVLAFIRQHREAGEAWEPITAKLNESGLRPQRSAEFKVNQVAKLYRYFARRERSVAQIGADARQRPAE